MNYLDIILIIIMGWAVLRGLKRGLILELATLVALVLGILAGFYFSDFISGLLERGFDYHGKYINIISFIIIFIAVIVLVRLLARIIEKAVKALALGFLNKLGGAIFSLLKFVFMISVLIYFMDRFDENKRIIKPETRSKSFFFPVIAKIAPVIIPKMQEHLEDFPALKKAEDEE